MDYPMVMCSTHRQKELEVKVEDGVLYVKPCTTCEAVRVVKTKREIRKNLIESLDKGVIP